MEHIKMILNFEKNTNYKIVLKESHKTANNNTSKHTLLHEHNPSLDILISIIPV